MRLLLDTHTLLSFFVGDNTVLTTLPFHHRDPFDRLLIAQATIEQMELVSIDSAFDDYSLKRLW